MVKGFKYSNEWYEKNISNGWLKKIKKEEDLVELYYKPHLKKKTSSITKMWGVVHPKGLGLECGFNSGLSLCVLGKMFDNIQMDAFDFNRSLVKILPAIGKMPHVRTLWICDARQLPPEDNRYDFINCCDFLEHIPIRIVTPVLYELRRVLKPGGLMGVYAGQSKKIPEHVNLKTPARWCKLIEKQGFSPLNNYLYEKV